MKHTFVIDFVVEQFAKEVELQNKLNLFNLSSNKLRRLSYPFLKEGCTFGRNFRQISQCLGEQEQIMLQSYLFIWCNNKGEYLVSMHRVST